MMRFDVMKVFINTSAIIGIIVFWAEFSKKVFKKVFQLSHETLYSSDCSDEEEGYWSDECSDGEEGYWSDECSEAFPQIHKTPPPYYSCPEPPPAYQLETD